MDCSESYGLTFRRPTGATHFTIAYGMKTVIPIEIDMPTAKMVMQGQKDNDKELEKHLNQANEIRKNAGIRMASYRQRAIAHYNKKVRPRFFRTGTLVLRRVFKNTVELGTGKLQGN